MNNIIPYKHPDPWKDAIARAGKDPEKLKTIAWMLIKEREWMLAEADKAGFTLVSRFHAPIWRN